MGNIRQYRLAKIKSDKKLKRKPSEGVLLFRGQRLNAFEAKELLGRAIKRLQQDGYHTDRFFSYLY